MISIYCQDSRASVAREVSVGRGNLSSPVDLILVNYPKLAKDGTITSGPRVSFMALTLLARRIFRLSCVYTSYNFQYEVWRG